MYLYFLYPELYKPILLYKHRYFSIRNLTSSIQNGAQIPYTHISIQIFIVPYSNFIVPYLRSPSFFFSFLFFFFFFFFFFFLSLLFFLIRFCSLFLQDQNEIFLLVLSLFYLIPFLFHFFSLSPSQKRKLPPSFLQATCLFYNFSSLFHSNIFLLLLFGP